MLSNKDKYKNKQNNTNMKNLMSFDEFVINEAGKFDDASGFNPEKETTSEEFNQELNESFWDDVKYGLSKLGRYKAGGKILGKKGTDDAAKLELREIMNKESNKLLKQVYGEVMIVAPEFPNDRKKITFLSIISKFN